MLRLNRSMRFIRCSRYEYMVKRGTISNYSFNLQDEDRLGTLEYLFERVDYPVARDRLLEILGTAFDATESDALTSVVDRLAELEILEDVAAGPSGARLLLLVDESASTLARPRFDNAGHDARIVSLDGSASASTEGSKLDDDSLSEAIGERDLTVVLTTSFAPGLFYRLNRLCLARGKALVIAYLDGSEGVIVPLLDPMKCGCYNDFEILRESSFYNLLDYQMVKERILADSAHAPLPDPLHLSALVDQTLLILRQLLKFTSIDYYAYSLDFERLVNTKTRLMKFPKCPSCQGDRDLVHPFI